MVPRLPSEALVQCACARFAGISTFEQELRDRNIVVHTDNTVAEHGLRKGRARSFDHNAIVHSIWAKAWQKSAGMWVTRVASKENIADDPSRER